MSPQRAVSQSTLSAGDLYVLPPARATVREAEAAVATLAMMAYRHHGGLKAVPDREQLKRHISELLEQGVEMLGLEGEAREAARAAAKLRLTQDNQPSTVSSNIEVAPDGL